MEKLGSSKARLQKIKTATGKERQDLLNKLANELSGRTGADKKDSTTSLHLNPDTSIIRENNIIINNAGKMAITQGSVEGIISNTVNEIKNHLYSESKKKNEGK